MKDLKENNTLIHLVLVFEKKWSGPCQIMEPIFNKLQIEYKDLIVRIDVEKNQELALSYGVNKIPAIIIIKNGLINDHLTGIISYKILMNKINNLIKIKEEE